jgi:hypothetical protein
MTKKESALTALPDDIENPEKDKNSDDYKPQYDPKELNRNTITALYFLIFFMSLFANIDHGTLPAGSVVIKKDLGMDNA